MTYRTITDAQDVNQALANWELAPKMDRGFDFETYGRSIKYANDTGPDVFDALITGVGLAHKDGGEWVEVYIPFAHRELVGNPPNYQPAEFQNTEVHVRAVLLTLALGGWGHNLGFESQVSLNHGVAWGSTAHMLDSQVAHWLAGQQFRLKCQDLALKKVARALKLETLGSFDDVAKNRDTRDVPVAELGPYCARDARLSVEVGQAAYRYLKEFDLVDHFHLIDMPLVEVARHMTETGYPIDTAEMTRLGDAWGRECEAIAQEFAKLTETTVLLKEKQRVPSGEYYKNGKPKLHSIEVDVPRTLGAAVGNDRQVSRWLYEELKWWPTAGLKRNDGGAWPVDKETLATMTPTTAEGRKAVELRLRYQTLTKLKSTYVVSLQNIAAQYADGKLHPSYKTTGTVTQRFSSSNPNGQNMPKGSPEAKEWGKTILVPEGWRGFETDLSQIELRLAAHYSGDEQLIDAYTWGIDIHKLTMDLVGCGRRPAKVLNFSNLYRISAGTLATKLAIQLKGDVTVEEAKDFQQRFLKAYAGVPRYWRKAIEYATKHGYAKTVDGFKQFLDMTPRKTKWGKMEPLWQSGQSAINTPIQGSAGGIMKLAMVFLSKHFTDSGELGRDIRFVGQVHDSLRYIIRKDLPEDQVQEMVALIEQTMNNAVTLRVPVDCETKEMVHGHWGGE